MKKRLFNDEWLFLKTSVNTEVSSVLDNMGGFMRVAIPHDHLIFNGKDLYEDCIGWYYRKLTLSQFSEYSVDYHSGNNVFLWFDGVYMDSTVYINGKEVLQWKYGYSSFYIDISEYVGLGDIDILVKTVHQSPNSRWYSGAGIYRDVYLFVCNKTYIPFGGTYFHSEKIKDSKDYAFSLSAEVINSSDNTKVKYELYNDKNKVSEGFLEKNTEDGNKMVYITKSVFDNPEEWDIDNPQLYTLITSVIEKENVLDQHVEKIGFKNVEFTTDRGLFLNGRHIKLNGVCEHHDFGCLGAAFYKDALVRKFTLLKKMGVNSIRTSHNMPASEFMNVADEMGILVLSEAFDMWEKPKTEYDYARFFNDWVEKDVESWIRRDRNHPSLLMWSIGNEISDTHAGERGYELTKMLMELVSRHDHLQNARITLGSNYMPWENTQKCAELYKLAGYNYAARYYADHHEKYKDWIIYGSETASIVMSRGVYHFPFHQSVLSDDDEQCSALGNSTTSWGAKSVEYCISDDRDVPFSLGQYLWTGFDYIGEPTPYHTRNSYFGQLDTAGFPKDSYYVFMSEWTDVKENPMVHIFPYWDFNRGQIIDVRGCTNGDSIELFVNGVSKGIKKLNHKVGVDFTATWKVPYKNGEITAVAYDESGVEITRETRKSFSNPAKLTICADKKEIDADGRSLVFLEIGAVDADDNPVENAMDYVDVVVDGPGYLVGLDNGDSTDFDEYKCTRRKLFNGKLLAVVLAGYEAGTVKVTASAEGLVQASVSVTLNDCILTEGIADKEAREFENKRIIDAARELDRVPIRKIDIIPVEIGNAGSVITLNKEADTCRFKVRLIPENTSDNDMEYRAVNSVGIEVDNAKISVDGDIVTVKAIGDGDFYFRAMARDGKGSVKLISHIEVKAENIGQAYMNPYKFVTGGLYSEEFGGVGNGNDKGFATSSDNTSGVVFRNVDFGPIGSDEITLPVFTFSNDPYPFKLYEGSPVDGELIYDGVYQKNYIWNVYQEETFKLPRRLKGVTDLGISFDTKVHVKGFIFKKYEKAYEKLNAADCSKVYGDSFKVNEKSVTGIGNNVTLEFSDMDFSERGFSKITIKGKTSLAYNTIHIQFINEEGDNTVQIVEFPKSEQYIERTFELNSIPDKCNVNFVFLPGSQFDFESFCFE